MASEREEPGAASVNGSASTSSSAPLVYILPVHNEELLLEANVDRLGRYLTRFPQSTILLVENGSTDASWSIAQRISAASSSDRARVLAFREEVAGLGFAYHRGLVEALDAFGAGPAWAVLTGADLPFGTSDLEAALVHLTRSSSRMLIGSKAHPDSRANTGVKRRAMSLAYRAARRGLLGMRVGDSQGSVFVRLDLAAELVPHVVSRDFFYSTELCHYAERKGESILELPVVLERSKRTSTVRPLKHGIEMARQLLALRRRSARTTVS